MYILLRESDLIIERDNFPTIHLDTLSSITCAQTFNEVSKDRKTLHNSKRFLKDKRVRSTNYITGNMVLYLTDTFKELMLFELAGWTNYGFGLQYPDYITNIPETFTLYIRNSEGSYKITNCVISTIDLALSKLYDGSLTIGFEASSMEPIAYPQYLATSTIQGAHLTPTPITTVFGNCSSQSIISAGIAFSRELTPLTETTVHNAGSILTLSKRVITDSNIDITVQCYGSNLPIANYDNFYIQQQGLRLELDNAIITKRDAVADIFTSSYDISPTHNTTNINIRY